MGIIRGLHICLNKNSYSIYFFLFSFRPTFASQITSGTTTALAEARNSNFKDTKHTLYVMLRQYRGLKSYGYGVTSKAVSYEPFKLTLTFREAPDENCISSQIPYKTTPSVNSSMLLVISATPVKSVYKCNFHYFVKFDETWTFKISNIFFLFNFSNHVASDEVFLGQREHTKFTTRHTASGVLSHVDGTASLLGFLPQDMLSRNIMEFYHPEDMPLLKEVYETIMIKGQTAGASFCGKPYRFLTHNGSYITIETEWSIFVNPWSHHLEFVIGYHHVMKGPSNPNVLESNDSQSQFPEKIINESKMIREEILKLLSEPVMRPNDTVKQQVSKRCQALASFMETLMDEVTKPGSQADLKLDLPQEADLTFSERDSVMLIGEISPHHDYFDSKSSSETPPSYNQLNYNENLQRFFDSRPVTVVEPDNMKMDQTDTEADTRTANLSPLQCFGESGGSESAGNMSSASNANMESITNTSTGTSNGSYIPPTLTEALLCKHNEDMEKLIIKRHKVSRINKGGEKNKKMQEQHSHGVKRSGSHSWEGEVHKTSKQQHIVESQKSVTPFPNHANTQPYQNANVDLWPPFSVSLTTIQSTHTTAHAATHFATSSIFPTVYYIPQNISPQDQTSSIQTLQYMPGLLYQSMLYPHPSTFYQMQFQATPTHTNVNESIYNTAFQFDKGSNISVPVLQKIPTPIGSGSQNQSTAFQRPPSQATSVKADMGSTSASVVNRVSILLCY